MKKDERITLETQSEVNILGNVEITFTELGAVWAGIKSQKGNEALEASRINATDTIRVCIKYRDDIGTKDRFLWRDNYYNITAIDKTDRRKGDLWITAQATQV